MDKSQAPAGFGMSSFPASVPPGLEYLTQIDQVLIHQKIELLEAFIGFETSNRYEVKNSLGQIVFNATEQSDCCVRNCCGPNRRFELTIRDLLDQEVIHLIKPFRCTSCCCPCFQQEMEVQAPQGNTLGYVIQDWHPFLPKFSILGPSKEPLLRIMGPVCTIACCSDVSFQILGKDEQQIGSITKQWSGCLKEALLDTDNFGVQFPLDLDVKMKAVLVGACFLIDFMFFEKVGKSGQRCSVFF
ncbi:phospholipid scramblase 1 [Chanos chanos]|uniref:Phospholipid scramblase n=1 Tax=Chanos chanos TaxID=29144 RepID=A0A6J2WX51_CHACN|nr:phospholipid scramblase 1-like [Chanos chanos]